MLTYLLFDLPIDVNLIADADLHVVNYKKGCTRLAAASDKVYQLLAHSRWATIFFYSCLDIFEVPLYLIIYRTSDSCGGSLRLLPPLKLVAMI